jgi:hypothetical protein
MISLGLNLLHAARDPYPPGHGCRCGGRRQRGCTISKSAAVVSMPMTMLTAAGTYESPSNFPNNALLAICDVNAAPHSKANNPKKSSLILRQPAQVKMRNA